MDESSIISEIVPQLMRTLTDQIRSVMEISRWQLTASNGANLEVQNDDREIEVHEFAIKAIKSYATEKIRLHQHHRNLLAPIHRLPSELISLIFQFAVTDSSPSPFQADISATKRVPLNVAGVSKRWRQVALDTPRIWAKIDMRSTSLVPLFLERSKGAPLDIETRSADIMALCEPHIGRWRALRALIATKEAPSWLLAPAPKLEILNLAHDFSRSLTRSEAISELFMNRTPCLRELNLTGLFILPTPVLFSPLTKLSLTSLLYDGPFTWSQFLQAIQFSLALEELRLNSVHAGGIPEADDAIKVSLPCLKVLVLNRVPPRFLPFILGRIIMPATSRLEVEVDITSGDWNSVLPRDISHLHNIQSARHLLFDAAPIATRGGDGCSLRGQGLGGETLFLFVVHGGHGGRRVVAQNLFSNMGQALPVLFESISITSYMEEKWSAAKFANSLSSFPSVEELSLNSCNPKFIRALTATPKRPPCPRLQRLKLTRCAIDESSLLSLVQARTSMKPRTGTRVPLQRLEITDCSQMNLSQEAISEMRECLEVHWDREGGAGPSGGMHDGVEENQRDLWIEFANQFRQ
ncbi:hypothetical protein BOTBODRAFT_144251 [Botryobasidium botryosum FD-172 SS1]|uniref:F-box domain-containing protein n=1 Tax=Botryobasidium botryosum (strain FD-172 SS1) TaxID=930990 RepID=A0A067MZX5_BOTB1|nr:hypothetical protein BOTBODRAFT_144251 [Botryobasidium botryosum FD-172 SS1]